MWATKDTLSYPMEASKVRKLLTSAKDAATIVGKATHRGMQLGVFPLNRLTVAELLKLADNAGYGLEITLTKK